jgi:hypothetical protein
MKLISIVFPIFLATGSSAAAAASSHDNKETNSVEEHLVRQSNLRGMANEADKLEVSHEFKNDRKLLTTRQQQWLDSHNTLREKYHKANNKSYVPMNWSNTLRRQSQIWANNLASNGCGLKTDPNNTYGQNLAVKYMSSVFPPTEDVLGSFEDKYNSGYPTNGAITQVLWRASTYVGCADATGTDSKGKGCVVSVCRYAKPGNCNMSAYTNWKTPTFMADSPCTPECPPGGCV